VSIVCGYAAAEVGDALSACIPEAGGWWQIEMLGMLSCMFGWKVQPRIYLDLLLDLHAMWSRQVSKLATASSRDASPGWSLQQLALHSQQQEQTLCTKGVSPREQQHWQWQQPVGH
jgi:hypothetical protein